MIEQMTSTQEFNETIKNSPDVLVEFFATWCPHCRKFYPVLEQAAAQLAAKGVRTVQCDVDKLSDLADTYQIDTIPTLVFFQNGQLMELSAGSRDIQGVLDFVKNAQA